MSKSAEHFAEIHQGGPQGAVTLDEDELVLSEGTDGHVGSAQDSEPEHNASQQIIFNDEYMQIKNKSKTIQNKVRHLWADHPKIERLKKILYDIQQMCIDEKIIFDRDQQRLAPLLEKFGIIA